MDLRGIVNGPSARRTTCPALTPSLVPKFYIPPKCNDISSNRKIEELPILSKNMKKMHPFHRWSIGMGRSPNQESSSSDVTKPQDLQSTNDEQLPCSQDRRSSVHIDSHFEFDMNADSIYQVKHDIWSDSDPGMKLSMTYDHIPKMKTPYGFSFLKCSPSDNVKRETLLLSQNFRNRMMPLSSSVCSHDLPCQDDERGEYSQKAVIDLSVVEVTSKTPVRRSVFVPNEQCQTEVHVSESLDMKRLNSKMSASFTCQPLPRRSSQTSSNANLHPLAASSTPNTRVRMVRKVNLSVAHGAYVDRSEMIDKLQMLCVRQHFETRSPNLGEIELSLKYDRRRRRLGVRVIQLNGVGLTSGSASRKISIYVRLRLLSEHADKETTKHTRLVEGTCDPTYDEEFSFNLSPYELISRRLEVRIFKGARFLLDKWPSSCLGEVVLTLADLKTSLQEIFLQKDLKPKGMIKDTRTSTLNISICYRSKSRKLCITVIRAQGLPRLGFCKTKPDCQVKVEVTQIKNNALSTVVKQTGFRRHSRNPVFKELMSFEINDLNNLRDGMTVLCTLSSKSFTGKPRIIGQVRFGVGASKESEKQQWANVLQHPGLSVTRWHTLLS
ncbi:synaptotagmin-like protein 3 [Lytechinus pictus]|uniref:synaptotagmin-like protein 3 n=1 Tax=Lytechinus pictus TaxID=7653 RepID=UPI0030B9CAD3